MSTSEEASSSPSFKYLGYGANMNKGTLARRNIEYTCLGPARVLGYRIVFNLGGFLPSETAFGNVEPCQNPEDVELHGVLYEMKQEQLHALDTYEGGGGAYIRREVTAETYDGVLHQTFIYICTNPERLKMGIVPSERYMNVLIKGGLSHGVKQEYIDYLRSLPFKPFAELKLTREVHEKIKSRTFTLEEVTSSVKRSASMAESIKNNQEQKDEFEKKMRGEFSTPPPTMVVPTAPSEPVYTALRGIVFDIRKLPPLLHRFFGGKEYTLDCGAFVCYEPVPARFEDLGPDQLRNINSNVAAFLSVCAPVGHIPEYAHWIPEPYDDDVAAATPSAPASL